MACRRSGRDATRRRCRYARQLHLLLICEADVTTSPQRALAFSWSHQWDPSWAEITNHLHCGLIAFEKEKSIFVRGC